LPFDGIPAKLAGLKFVSGKIFQRARYPIAIGAGLLLASSMPKLSFAGFAWITPALWLAVAHERKGWGAFRIGYVAGLAYYLASLYWILLIPAGWYPVLGWIALTAYLALYPATWVWLMAGKVGTGNWAQRTRWSLAGAALWVALEMIVSRLFSGFPWNLLGTSQYQLLPLIQIASVVGVYGVSFLVVWVSLSLFSATLAIVRQPTARQAWLGEVILPFAAVVLAYGWGMGRLKESDADRPTLRVTCIQPSIPQTVIWDQSANSSRFEKLLRLTEQGLTNKTDLLVWPEAAMPEFTDENFIAITNLISRHGVWMIFGADDVVPKREPVGDDRYDAYNASFLFDSGGHYVERYHKQKLVIFGEYIPLVRWLPFIKWFTPITGSFASGDKPVPFVLERRSPTGPVEGENGKRAVPEAGAPPRIKTSTLICFEDVFSHVVPEYVDPDTDFLINLTNDGWFGESAEQWQQAASAAFRAVENNVPLVRSCNNGLTCWIDSRGRIRQIFRDAKGTVYGPGTITMEVPTLRPGETRVPTSYNRYGDRFGWGCVGVSAIILVNQLRNLQWRRRIAPAKDETTK